MSWFSDNLQEFDPATDSHHSADLIFELTTLGYLVDWVDDKSPFSIKEGDVIPEGDLVKMIKGGQTSYSHLRHSEEDNKLTIYLFGGKEK